MFDKERRRLKMNTPLGKQLDKNDPTLKIVPLYYPPMTCPLMNNNDFLSIAYIDIIQNMLDRKIILSYKNLIELIAIALHERCQRLNTQ
ncbi:hypothetical protein T11_12300, partial [Trichinella zimbabwensis]